MKEIVGKEVTKKEPPTKTMTPDDRKRSLIEGIKKTVVPAFIGAVFAILFFSIGDKVAGKPWFSVLLLVVLISYYIQRLFYPLIGVRARDFQLKDWLYVEFFTIIFMLVFWILLLNE